MDLDGKKRAESATLGRGPGRELTNGHGTRGKGREQSGKEVRARRTRAVRRARGVRAGALPGCGA